MPTTTFTAALLAFFGRLPGQTTSDFAKEIKALTPADKSELHALLCAAGHPCTPPGETK